MKIKVIEALILNNYYLYTTKHLKNQDFFEIIFDRA